MPWGQVTTDDVLGEFSQAEQRSIAGALSGASLVAPSVQVVLGNVIKAVRGAVLAGGNAVGPQGTTPDQLALTVISIARWRWLSAVPALNQLKTKDREDLYRDATRELQDVASGKIKVELPSAADIAAMVEVPVNQVETATRMKRQTVKVRSDGSVHSRMRGLI